VSNIDIVFAKHCVGIRKPAETARGGKVVNKLEEEFLWPAKNPLSD